MIRAFCQADSTRPGKIDSSNCRNDKKLIQHKKTVTCFSLNQTLAHHPLLPELHAATQWLQEHP